ncbi:ATP-binding protein [Kitasatospora sp. NPDC001574]
MQRRFAGRAEPHQPRAPAPSWTTWSAVVGELFANTALHAGPDLIRARLLLEAAGNRLCVEVEDRSAVLPLAATAPGDDREVTGRGLLIVEALADRWGVDLTPEGKAVWAEFDLTEPLDWSAVVGRARQESARADWTVAARMGTGPVRLPTCRPRVPIRPR